MTDVKGGPSFSNEFDDEFALGGSDASKAYFGRNVLRGLIEGINDFTSDHRWRESRWAGAVLLGSAMWIDDEELLGKIAGLSGDGKLTWSTVWRTSPA